MGAARLWLLVGWLLLGAGAAPEWVWRGGSEPATPVNVYTLFRTVFDRPPASPAPALRLAADSQAAVFLNGHLLTRKVTRYAYAHATADLIPLPAELLQPRNALVVRHHNWGGITTFQRTGQAHAGLYVDSNFGLETNNQTWRWQQDPQYTVHTDQVVGVTGDHRIRFPTLVDARRQLPAAVFAPDFDDGAWPPAAPVRGGPWPATPPTSETTAAGRAQAGAVLAPATVLAAGTLVPRQPLSADPYSVAAGIGGAAYRPDPDLAAAVRAALAAGTTVRLQGAANTSLYVTVDLGQPAHGYPVLELDADQPEGVVVDLGYTEKPFDLYSGAAFVDAATGWLNPTGIVGTGYADRYTTRAGAQSAELPDERTARWLTLNVHFPAGGGTLLSLRRVGVQQWMYDVAAQGSFETGDATIDQIVALSLVHARVSMSDTYVDCPGREDGQWIEDARPRAQLAERWFNDSALRRVLIRHVAEAQRADGSLHPFPPSNYPATASADWAVQWVAAVYDDFLWRGAAAATADVRAVWPAVKRYWGATLAQLRPDGVWTGGCLNDIRNTPACPGQPCSSGSVTPWMIERLGWSATLADAVGDAASAATWRAAAQQMTAAFRKYHLVQAQGSVPTHVASVIGLVNGVWTPAGVGQAGQPVAAYTGLLTPAEALAALNYTFPGPDGSPPSGVPRWNNPTYLLRSLRALSAAGLTDRALNHLRERFAQYLPGSPVNDAPPALQGRMGGPLPEYWISRRDLQLSPGQNNPTQPVDGTGSHGWASVGLLWLHTDVLGVTDAAAGLRIAPDDAGQLPYVRGQTFTARGAVLVDWQPGNRTLTVGLPDASGEAALTTPGKCPGELRVVLVPPAGRVVATTGQTATVSGGGRWQTHC